MHEENCFCDTLNSQTVCKHAHCCVFFQQTLFSHTTLLMALMLTVTPKFFTCASLGQDIFPFDDQCDFEKEIVSAIQKRQFPNDCFLSFLKLL